MKAESLQDNAATIRQRAEALVGENSGKTIDAMYQMCQRQAAAVSRWAETYRSMARAVSEIARIIYSARSTLDRIDANANEEIERIQQEAAAHARLGTSALVYAEAQQRIAAVIAAAKAEATAESATAAAKIASVASTMGGAQIAPPGGPERHTTCRPRASKILRNSAAAPDAACTASSRILHRQSGGDNSSSSPVPSNTKGGAEPGAAHQPRYPTSQ